MYDTNIREIISASKVSIRPFQRLYNVALYCGEIYSPADQDPVVSGVGKLTKTAH